jgi:hypothetical protein
MNRASTPEDGTLCILEGEVSVRLSELPTPSVLVFRTVVRRWRSKFDQVKHPNQTWRGAAR